MKAGRKPKKKITKDLEAVYVALRKHGDSQRQAARITGIPDSTWRNHAKANKAFGALLDKASEQGASGLSVLLRQSMREQIKRGHPWWAKLAIWNYNVGLVDPDRRLEQVTHDANRQIETFYRRVIAIMLKHGSKANVSKMLNDLEDLPRSIQTPTKMGQESNPK